jgi:hypothetical protein
MIVQTVHEIVNPFDAYARELGDCLVMFMITGSVTSNPQFIVRIYNSGIIRTVDQNDLVLYGNPTAGESLVPPIPDDWKPKEPRWPKDAKRNMDFLNKNNTNDTGKIKNGSKL